MCSDSIVSIPCNYPKTRLGKLYRPSIISLCFDSFCMIHQIDWISSRSRQQVLETHCKLLEFVLDYQEPVILEELDQIRVFSEKLGLVQLGFQDNIMYFSDGFCFQKVLGGYILLKHGFKYPAHEVSIFLASDLLEFAQGLNDPQAPVIASALIDDKELQEKLGYQPILWN